MQCKGKIRYLSARSAASIVGRMKQETARRRVRNQLLNPSKSNSGEHDNLGVYRCIHCTFYHVGHDRRMIVSPDGVGRASEGSCLEMMINKRLIAIA